MTAIITLLFGILLGGLLVYLVFMSRKEKSPAKGVSDFMEKQQESKQSGKEKILGYLEQNVSIANNDVEKLLGVSDATASRYLSELKDEGKIKQVGERGRFVSYQSKK